ncbi:zinc protease [Labilithrix luteola]|uniref:Zinc protease n=1 Tax=Labilithrix luteola TaxID=1391654 RepID=A0A0K1Q8G0_9BACT|nr:zinc protease [Labilithrix luteola]
MATAAPPPADPLGPRPELKTPEPFTPPVPTSWQRPNGMIVWLLERHTLPVVAMQVVIPGAGSAGDAPDKGGLALTTANMLDEGAGTRGPLDIARDIDRLGATLATGAYTEYAFAQLTSLKKNLAPAAAILGDVLGKPKFSPVEWKRVHDLWENDLRARQSEPNAVAGVVSARQLFGSDPYGHPVNGTLKSAAKVSLDDVKTFYAQWWHPEAATVVVAGDITRAELDPLLDKAFAGWQPARTKKPPAAPTKSPSASAEAGRRVVVVDRPDAPQSVISVVRLGVAASSPEAPPLVRVNAALGGSFTSRLNQDLREEHGWSYGARSRFSFTRRPGMFAAEAAVHTEHTGEALKAMLVDIEELAKGGLTKEEVEKTRLLARGELVESFEAVEAAARRLARNAGVGLGPDHEAKASALLYGATKADLDKLAAEHIDVKNGIVVIVGPRAKLEPQLKAIGITKIEASGPEGD